MVQLFLWFVLLQFKGIFLACIIWQYPQDDMGPLSTNELSQRFQLHTD